MVRVVDYSVASSNTKALYKALLEAGYCYRAIFEKSEFQARIIRINILDDKDSACSSSRTLDGNFWKLWVSQNRRARTFERSLLAGFCNKESVIFHDSLFHLGHRLASNSAAAFPERLHGSEINRTSCQSSLLKSPSSLVQRLLQYVSIEVVSKLRDMYDSFVVRRLETNWFGSLSRLEEAVILAACRACSNNAVRMAENVFY